MADVVKPEDSNEPKFPSFEPRLSITDRPSSIPVAEDEAHPGACEDSGNNSNNTFSKFGNAIIPKSTYFSLFTCLETRHDKALLPIGIILAIAAGAPLPIIGLLFSQIIDTFPPPADQLRTRLYELIGVACIYFVLTYGWTICFGCVGERISRNRREALVKSVVGMEMATFDTSAPDIATSLTADCQLILLGTSEKVGLFIQSISYFVATIIVGFILNATLTGILLAAVVPSMAIVIIGGSSLTSKWSKRAAKFSEAAAKVSENAIGSVRIVQAYDIASTFLRRHEALLTWQIRAGIRKSVVSAVMLGCVYFVCYSINALAFFEGGRLDGGGGGAGKVYAIVFLLLDATFVIGMVAPFLQTISNAGDASERISGLIRPPKNIDVYSDAGIKVEDSHMQGDVVLRDVSFTYPARDDVQVLNSVNITFQPGTFSALVGLSGSGKSTVASLLLRLYDPDEGQILIDDTDMKALNVASFRSHVALVDQDSVLFEGTILQNISQGLLHQKSIPPDTALDLCMKAVDEANCDFVHSLSKGVHTKVGGSDGVELSGGQCQRISLARALVRRPALLILDEPTSALDARSERLIMQSLKNAAKTGMTIVMVAHRLVTIAHADNIVVMESGKVIEQGKHDELLEAAGLYAQLLSTQQANPSDEVSNVSPISSTDSIDTIVDDELEATPSHKTYNVDIEAASTSTLAKEGPEQRLSTSRVLGRVWSLSRKERPFIFLGILASIISGAIIIGEAFIFGHLVAALNSEVNETSTVHFYCLMFFVLAIIALLAYSASGTCFGFVSERLVARVQNLSLRKILNQDQAFFSTDGHGVHQLTAAMKSDCGALAGLSGVIVGMLCSITTSMLGGIILAHVVAWKIAVVLLAAVPVMMFACYLRLSTSAKFEERHKSAYNGAAALATEACKGIRTVAAYGLEHDILKRYKETVKKPYDESTRNILTGNLILAMSYSITYFVYALAYWWGATQVRSGMYNELQFFIVLPALLFSAQTSGQLFSMSPELTRAKVAAQSVFNLLDTKPTIIIEDITQISHPTTSSPNEKDEIPDILTFNDVSLLYPSQPTPSLQNFNLTISPGEFIGIVGPSGAGKSTIVSLLSRFYDATSGTITSNSTPITDLQIHTHRSQMSLVPQTPDLFDGSIAFNISLGASPGTTPTQAQIEAVAQKCHMHDFIASLPQGYQTECGSNGSQLSGGQKQRIAIARALLRDPKILLLDECTASLDAMSEKVVLEAVQEAGKGRTVVMVTHRLCGVVDADRIVVMDGGRVVEMGTHAELMRKEGLYAIMARGQGLS